MTNKSKRSDNAPIGLFMPLAPWRKKLSIFFLVMISTWVVPPHAIAYEIAQAQQKTQIEEAQRDQRTKPSPHIKISQQTEATSQLLIKTCKQIETNLAEGKSNDSEIKDIEAFRKNYDEIKDRALKQMAAQRAQMVERKSSEKMLERLDARQKEITSRFEEMSGLLKAVSDNKSKPEELKKSVQALSQYLEKHSKQPNAAPKTSDPKAYLPRQSTKADSIANVSMNSTHNGILLASAEDKTIGDWLQGLNTASGPATAADLAATSEIIIDDEIRVLAETLEKRPVKIFEYIRNNFAYEPYWGAQKGSKRTLLEKAGNDVDLASLMMALLRASGINCRYVCGTIEMPIADAGKWIGVDDPTQIAKTFQANGIPFETKTSGGKISSIKINHTWVNAYVDFFPYHGSRNAEPNTWIEMDPSFKQNTFTTKTDLQTTIGINPDTLLVNVKAQSELGADNLYAAKVPEAFILSEIFSYQEPIRSYLAANSLTTESVFRQRKVNEEKYGLFTVTDQYDIISRGLSFNKIPETLTSSVTFSLKNPDNSVAFTYTASLPAIAMSRVTLGYTPATDSDREQITANASRNEFPVYLVNLKPELKIDDTVVGTGTAVGMGRKQTLDVTFNVPGFDPSQSQTLVTVGSFSSLITDYQTVTAAEISRQQTRLAALAASAGSSRDELLGEALRGLGLSYWHQLDRFNQVTAGNLGVAITRVPSMLKVSWDLNVAEQFGLPYTASVDRVKLNIIRDYNVPVAINQEKLAGEKQFAFTSALTGTALEHNVLAQPFAGEASSAARVIQQANNTNKKVYTITAKNVNEIIPKLTLPAAMINDIRNAVNANQEVTVPESAVNLNGVEYFSYARRDIDTSASEFYLDSRGGEMVNNTLTAADLLMNGSAANYANVTKPLADWLNIAVDSTTNAGLAYLPAITALNSWYEKRTALDPVTTIAAIIAVSGPITKVYNQPAILNVTTGDKLISPNGDGIKDSFTLQAVVTRNAAWKFQILNAQNQVIITEENTTPNINIDFNQNIPDGTYTYRITAAANGVNADPVSGTFRVDCTKPTVAFTSPDPATTITQNKSIALRGTADDINFDKVVITAKGVDAEPVTVYESNNITVENLLATIVSAKYTNGPLVITMTAWDKAGNSNSVNQTFTLNNPVPDLQAPTVNMIAKNSGADIVAGTTVDAESGKLDIAITAADNIGVTKINLLLDGAITATAANATELNHIINTMVLRDGAHTLQAEAYDAAGNNAKSALLNFTLTSPVSNFRVSPTLAKPGTSQINVSANLREAASWTLTFNGPGNIPEISGTTASVTGSFNPASYAEGEYTVTLTVNDKNPSLPFIINMILNQPTAKIANLNKSSEDAIPVVREGLFTLIGTADDVDVADTVSYKVEVYNHEGERIADVTPKPVNDKGYRVGRVNNAALGELDFTMLRNNVYTLRLTVTDGQFTSTDEADFALNSELKIGQMSFSQQDLVIPVNGHPISVIRTYNSLNSKVKGDFGYGWTYSIKDIEVEFNENRYNTRDDYGQIFSCRSGGSRDVTVTMPDGKRATFVHSMRSSGGYYPTTKNYWTAPAGVYATLEPTCSNEIVSLFGGMTYWSAAGPGTEIEQFDIPGYILTLKDGTKYEIAREDLGEHIFDFDDFMTSTIPYVHAYGKAYVRSITDTNGNRTVFEPNEIVAYNATGERSKSIYFDRNSDGMITAIYAPENQKADGTPAVNALANFKYEYDNNGNLTKAIRLIDSSQTVNDQYAVTKFLYEEPSRPHFVTGIVSPDGKQPLKCIYDDSGKLIATEDASGNRTTMVSDISSRIETLYDVYGNPTIYSYDARGNITSVTNAIGSVIQAKYDDYGNELSVINPLGYVITKEYDSRGNITQYIDQMGNCIRFEYDNRNNLTKLVDAMGNITYYQYNDNNSLVCVKNPVGETINYSFSANGNLDRVLDTQGRLLKTFNHDSSGHLIKTTNSFGLESIYSYDSNGNMKSNGFIWNGIEKNNKIQHNDNGDIITNIDYEGNTFHLKYDISGRISQQTDILGNSVEYIYDDSGNTIEVKHANGMIARTVYDKMGRKTITQDIHAPGQKADGTRTTFDSIGRCVKIERLSNVVIDINGSSSSMTSFDDVVSWKSYSFDNYINPIEEKDSFGNRIFRKYDPLNRVVESMDELGNKYEYFYNPNGKLIATKDPSGNRYESIFDATGKKIKTILPSGSKVDFRYNIDQDSVEAIASDELSIKYQQDIVGRLVKVAKENSEWKYTYDKYGNLESIEDPLGNFIRYSYNYLGNIISASNYDGHITRYEYDQFGRKVKSTDNLGQVTEISYNSSGLSSRVKYYKNDSNDDPEVVNFEYDEMERVKKVIEPRGTTEYTYDYEGKITHIQTPEGWIKYTYDEKSKNRTQILTANTDIRYGYDAKSRLISVTVYKKNGILLSAAEETIYHYNDKGLRYRTDYPNGIKAIYEFNDNVQISSLCYQKADGSILSQYEYSYFINGLLKTAIEKYLVNGELVSSTVNYQYDSLYRLKEEVRSGYNAFSIKYNFDKKGNRIQQTKSINGLNEIIDYEYNAKDQIISESSNISGMIHYEYNDNGAMIRKYNAKKFDYRFNYDLRNRLSGANVIKNEAGLQTVINTKYVYNIFGNRVLASEEVNGIKQVKCFLRVNEHTGLSNILEEFNIQDSNRNITRSNIWGHGLLYQNTENNTSYPLCDRRGNTRQTINNQYDINSIDYDAFGNILNENLGIIPKTQSMNHLFSGEEFDAALQMSYMRQRYYDANTGRFNRMDTFRGDIRYPETLHKYLYCDNDPVNRSDPSGYQFTMIDLMAVMSCIMILNFAISGTASKAKSKAVGFRDNLMDTTDTIQIHERFNPKHYLSAMPLLDEVRRNNNTDYVGFYFEQEAQYANFTRVVQYGRYTSVIRAVDALDTVFTANDIAMAALPVVAWGQSVKYGKSVIHFPSKQHGVTEHWDEILKWAGSKADEGIEYDIFLHKTLKKSSGGRVPSLRKPDGVAVLRNTPETSPLNMVEVASPTQITTQEGKSVFTTKYQDKLQSLQDEITKHGVEKNLETIIPNFKSVEKP